MNTLTSTVDQSIGVNHAAIAPRHQHEWEASGVQLDIIARNVWTIEDARDLDQLLNRNTNTRWKHSDELVPGWAVAGVDPKTGEPTFKGAQFKPDKAPMDPTTHKPRKYFSPSKIAISPLFLSMEDSDYWSKLITHFTTPIVITEGAKKAGAVLSQGIPCISIPGVTTGGKLGRLRPELELFCRYGRQIYLAFDRDIVTKPAVRSALHNLGRMLSAKGAMVYVLEWRNSQKGIDDYLAAGGQLHTCIGQAKTLEEWKDGQEDSPELMEVETCRLAQRYQWVEGKLKGRLRWNNLKGVIELDGEPIDLDNLRLYLALKHNIDIPDDDCTKICTYMAKQQLFSPVAEYLHQCADLYGPDDELLNSIAQTYLGSDSPLHATFIRKTLISAVARACSPGCKVDTVCILSGVQGVGKSSFWKVLAGEDWFDDSVGSVSDKDERLKLHQSWFVEWAELEAVFKRKDISAVKAFITTQTDQIRPPYGRTVKEFPRPSIIVGTTNFDEFLADPTGNRRFWVVPIVAAWIPLDQLASERDRIWAAATHAFLQGENWTLPPEMRQQVAMANQDYQLSDPWEEKILEYITGKPNVTASEVLSDAIGLELDRQDRGSQMRVTNLLKAKGWTSSRRWVHGSNLRIWIPPVLDKEVGKVGKVGSIDIKSPPETESELNQPVYQPPDQPLNSAAEKLENPECTNLTNQPNQIPKSSRIQFHVGYDTKSLKPGDRIVVRGNGVLIKTGSDKLPRQDFLELPRQYKKATEIPLGLLNGPIFHELMDGGEVINLSRDQQRVKVKHPTTGRISVFRVSDVEVLEVANADES
ncbi:MAG: DUF3854 domain-containing protein [Cyanothece sp. SIO1E1]|nr:DUF3854 domain-containing protein [Cyanothece sp. SIO1E1]